MRSLLITLSLATLGFAQEEPREYLKELQREALAAAHAAASGGEPIDCGLLASEPQPCREQATCKWVSGFGCARKRCEDYLAPKPCAAGGTGCRWAADAVDDLGVVQPACVTKGLDETGTAAAAGSGSGSAAAAVEATVVAK
jgi:hypothetical protein